MHEALHILCSTPAIVSLSRSIIRYSATLATTRMLQELTQLKGFVIERFNTTAEQEHAKNEYLLSVFDKNEKAKKRLQGTCAHSGKKG